MDIMFFDGLYLGFAEPLWHHLLKQADHWGDK
jgi:hypothetical protein